MCDVLWLYERMNEGQRWMKKRQNARNRNVVLHHPLFLQEALLCMGKVNKFLHAQHLTDPHQSRHTVSIHSPVLVDIVVVVQDRNGFGRGRWGGGGINRRLGRHWRLFIVNRRRQFSASLWGLCLFFCHRLGLRGGCPLSFDTLARRGLDSGPLLTRA